MTSKTLEGLISSHFKCYCADAIIIRLDFLEIVGFSIIIPRKFINFLII